MVTVVTVFDLKDGVRFDEVSEQKLVRTKAELAEVKCCAVGD